MADAIDQETGLETLAAEEKRVRADIELLISEGQALQQMKLGKGWKILASFIEMAIESSKEKLLEETRYDEIRRLQEYVKAYSNVLGFVESRIAEAVEAAEMISEDGSTNGPDPEGGTGQPGDENGR